MRWGYASSRAPQVWSGTMLVRCTGTGCTWCPPRRSQDQVEAMLAGQLGWRGMAHVLPGGCCLGLAWWGTDGGNVSDHWPDPCQ